MGDGVRSHPNIHPFHPPMIHGGNDDLSELKTNSNYFYFLFFYFLINATTSAILQHGKLQYEHYVFTSKFMQH